jgi:quinol monooxygenase YgiN
MYGTIAKITVSPGKIEDLLALADTLETPPGQLTRYVYQMDADPHNFILVAVFESREAYWANANDPAQHERFMKLRALLTADPEWNDGEIVDAVP